MKKWNLFLLICLLGFSTSWAQKSKKGVETESVSAAPMVAENVLNMSAGAHNSFSMLLPSTDVKTVKSLWKDLMKNYDSKVKKVKKSDDDLAAAARIGSISGNGTVDVYSQITESGDNVSMAVWFDMGDGKFLSSSDYPNTFEDAEQLMQSFSVSVKKHTVEKELKGEEKNLKKVENELSSLQKKKKNLENDIEKWKKKIQDAEEEIVQNEAAQEETKSRIEEQKGVVSEVATRLQNIE